MQKQKAKQILTKYELTKWLADNIGKPRVIGSYAMDLMVANDLDIDIESGSMSLDKLYSLTQFVTKSFSPTWYEAKEVVNEQQEKEWFFGFEFLFDSELWNVDLWFLSVDKIKQAKAFCAYICKQISNCPKYRDTVLKLKKELLQQNLYACDKFNSTDVYNAVLHCGISDLKSFLSKFGNGKIRRYILVTFEHSSFEYTYLCENFDVEVGDVVNAPSDNYKFYSPALVKQIKFLSDNELPVAKSRILRIDTIISKQDRAFIFDSVGFMKSKIDAELLKEWKDFHQNDWCKFYGSTFGGIVAYEQDGVLHLGYGEYTDEDSDCFETYTITSTENFEVKIDFAKTLVSQLYYKKITEEEVEEWIKRI